MLSDWLRWFPYRIILILKLIWIPPKVRIQSARLVSGCLFFEITISRCRNTLNCARLSGWYRLRYTTFWEHRPRQLAVIISKLWKHLFLYFRLAFSVSLVSKHPSCITIYRTPYTECFVYLDLEISYKNDLETKKSLIVIFIFSKRTTYSLHVFL